MLRNVSFIQRFQLKNNLIVSCEYWRISSQWICDAAVCYLSVKKFESVPLRLMKAGGGGGGGGRTKKGKGRRRKEEEEEETVTNIFPYIPHYRILFSHKNDGRGLPFGKPG